MNECHEFWFWFTRPMAETLGGLAMFFALVVIWTIGAVILDAWKSARKSRP